MQPIACITPTPPFPVMSIIDCFNPGKLGTVAGCLGVHVKFTVVMMMEHSRVLAYSRKWLKTRCLFLFHVNSFLPR